MEEVPEQGVLLDGMNDDNRDTAKKHWKAITLCCEWAAELRERFCY
jgi:hypothetical protein